MVTWNNKDKAILSYLQDSSDEDGDINIEVREMSEETQFSHEAVDESVQKLAEHGYIEIKSQFGGANVRKVVPRKP